jgi:hypothetical protein
MAEREPTRPHTFLTTTLFFLLDTCFRVDLYRTYVCMCI